MLWQPQYFILKLQSLFLSLKKQSKNCELHRHLALHNPPMDPNGCRQNESPNCWVIMMLFSAFWALNSDGTHSLQSIAETVMQWCIYPNLMKKQTHLHLGWPEGEHITDCFHSVALNLLHDFFIISTALIKMWAVQIWNGHKWLLWKLFVYAWQTRRGSCMIFSLPIEPWGEAQDYMFLQM